MRLETGIVDFFVNRPGKMFGKIHGDDGLGLVFFHFDRRVCVGDEIRVPKKGDAVAFLSENSHRGPRVKWWAFNDEFSADKVPVHPEEQRRRAVDQVEIENIRKNLVRFGVEDLEVIGEATTVSGQYVYTDVVKLSDLLSRYAVRDLFDTTPRDYVDSVVYVLPADRSLGALGIIDSDLRFHYDKAPDLATFLAYAVASDGGRERELFLFSPNGSAKQLLRTMDPIEADPIDAVADRVYRHDFLRCLAAQFVYKKTSRYADGHSGFRHGAWEIASHQRFGRDVHSGSKMSFY